MNDRFRTKSPAVVCAVSGTRYTLYQTPVQCRSVVRFLNVASGAASNIIVLELYKASSTSRFKLVNSKSISAGEVITFSDIAINLDEGDRIEVTATSGTLNTEAICTVEEYFRPVG